MHRGQRLDDQPVEALVVVGQRRQIDAAVPAHQKADVRGQVLQERVGDVQPGSARPRGDARRQPGIPDVGRHGGQLMAVRVAGPATTPIGRSREGGAKGGIRRVPRGTAARVAVAAQLALGGLLDVVPPPRSSGSGSTKSDLRNRGVFLMDRARTGGERETARSARCHGGRVGSRVIRRLTAAILVTTCFVRGLTRSPALARRWVNVAFSNAPCAPQPRSRAGWVTRAEAAGGRRTQPRSRAEVGARQIL